ncbi:MAG: hypothetical protein ACP5Q0_06650, partial [Halothiobacillus sp.]
RLAKAISQGRFNTLSAAMSMLALANLAGNQADPVGLSLKQKGTDGALQAFGRVKGVILSGEIALDSRAVEFSVDSKNPAQTQAWYALAQSGYDRNPSTKTLKEGLEIVRTYTDAAGKPVDHVTLGQTIDVHISLRALGDIAVGDVAVVDILPGGFELVPNPPPAPPAPASDGADGGSADPQANIDNAPADDATSDNGTADNSEAQPDAPQDPLAQPGSHLAVNYVEPREDRVLIYAEANRDVQQYIYRIRATNTGSFMRPPAYASSMYDRSLVAYAPGTGTLTVLPPAPAAPAAQP